ncbi:hypothetical protein CB0940_04505 [Cercospora beticola]|uniref:Uncharacterized protein n=1 Tax=Cercospora beticola TaxID=122368 RepID=A0A2G5HN21_CERBT|nr:hypothetical protein CB0940_04505 [Cercospora beticola]PIA93956.1 hypothetical protein CB0940_04505 [Cercospora beticola]
MNVYPLPPYQRVNLSFPFQHHKKQKTPKMPSSRSCSWRLKKKVDVDAETRRNTHLNSLPTTNYSEKHSGSERSLRSTSTMSSLRTSNSVQSGTASANNSLKLSETATSSTSRKSGWLRRVFSSSSSGSGTSSPGDEDEGKRAYFTKKEKKDRPRKPIEDEDDYDYEREIHNEQRAAWRQLSMGYASVGVPFIF